MDMNRKSLAIQPPARAPAKHDWWRRRWLRWTLVAVAIAGLLAALHRPLFRGVASFLISDQPVERADYFVLLPGIADRGPGVDAAARHYAAGNVGGILLFESPMSRAVRCGAWPDRATALRRALAERGVPAAAIVVPPEPCRTSWDAAHAIQHWLQNRPDTRLIIEDRLLRGRYDRRIFDSVLDARQAADLQFTAVRSGVDENNWWQSREGIQLVFQNYVAIAFDWCHGESEQCSSPWTLEDFENSLSRPADR
jgi:hypothetical protein